MPVEARCRSGPGQPSVAAAARTRAADSREAREGSTTTLGATLFAVTQDVALTLLGTWWFPAGLPALEPAALRDSPISFKRHGAFVTAPAFDRV